MSQTKLRMAVGYHFFNDFDTLPNVLEQVCSTYNGPLALATDYIVFNVTKENIKVRQGLRTISHLLEYIYKKNLVYFIFPVCQDSCLIT